MYQEPNSSFLQRKSVVLSLVDLAAPAEDKRKKKAEQR